MSRLDLAPDAGDAALLCRQPVLRCLQRQPVVAVVDPGDYVARAHLLVVGDLDRTDIALGVGGEQGDVALDIGVVGSNQEAPVGPPVVAQVTAIGRSREQQRSEEQAFDGAATHRRWPGRRDDARGRPDCGGDRRAANRRLTANFRAVHVHDPIFVQCH